MLFSSKGKHHYIKKLSDKHLGKPLFIDKFGKKNISDAAPKDGKPFNKANTVLSYIDDTMYNRESNSKNNNTNELFYEFEDLDLNNYDMKYFTHHQKPKCRFAKQRDQEYQISFQKHKDNSHKNRYSNNQVFQHNRVNLSFFEDRFEKLKNQNLGLDLSVHETELNDSIDDSLIRKTQELEKLFRDHTEKIKNNSGVSVQYDNSKKNYVNGNFIPRWGSQGRGKTYIATQGPKNTVSDYWKMVVTTGSQFLIMVAKEIENNRPKCDVYWPEKYDPLEIYDQNDLGYDTRKLLTLHLEDQKDLIRPDLELKIDSSDRKDYVYGYLRIIKVTCHQQSFLAEQMVQREYPLNYIQQISKEEETSWFVYHYQYTKWPDFGVPKEVFNILDMMHKINIRYEELSRHCHEIGEYANDLKYGLRKIFLFIERSDTKTQGHKTYRSRENLNAQIQYTKLKKRFFFSYNPYKLETPKHGETYRGLRNVENFRFHQILGGSRGLIGPIIVNCSAGVGRTGTIIALDQIIDQIKWFGFDTPINIKEIVRKLRKYRCGMVQKREQYKFIYTCAASYISNFQSVCQQRLEKMITDLNPNQDSNADNFYSDNNYNGTLFYSGVQQDSQDIDYYKMSTSNRSPVEIDPDDEDVEHYTNDTQTVPSTKAT